MSLKDSKTEQNLKDAFTVVPVRSVEHLISRSYGPSMAPFASILGQKVAINQILNLLHGSNGKS